jgi:hypothetical protein
VVRVDEPSTYANPYPDNLDAEDLAWQRIWGAWRPWSVAEVQALLEPVGIAWWIVGGRAMEAFHGAPRPHEDLDAAIFRRDVGILRDALRGRLHLWAPGASSLTLLDDPGTAVPEHSEQVWIREHAMAPWRIDVVLSEDRDGHWRSRRDPDLTLPVEDATWLSGGVRYLRPELALSYKAIQLRAKDEHDFAAALPQMSAAARTYLADFLARKHPEHPWRERL